MQLIGRHAQASSVEQRRVLMVHPSSELYGSDRMLLESAKAALDARFQVLVALNEDGPLSGHLREAGATVMICRAPVLRKSSMTPRGVVRLATSAALSARRQVGLLRRVRPSVLYVSTLTMPTWPILGRLLGFRVIGHVHEAEDRSPRLVRWMLANPFLACHNVLVNSSYAGDVLVSAQPRLLSRSRLVLNGVEGPPAAVKPPAGRTEADPVRLLYLGRLSQRKGVFVALAAVESLLKKGINVRLDLVGSAFEEHGRAAKALELRLEEPILRPAVQLHNFTEDVWSHIASCDIMLVPSTLPEPFGNTAVEGLLAGRPVIASNIGGLPEALSGAPGARLVAAGDADALAEVIESTIEDLARIQALAVEGAERAKRRFAVDRYRHEVAQAMINASSD